jgi:pimeloyl-ACP methyl ester carboxylesterase
MGLRAKRAARRSAGGLGVSLLLIVGLLLGGASAYGASRGHAAVRRARTDRRAATTKPAGVDYNHNPVIFVHGFDGSGGQFESQQMRLTSNGYPGSYIFVFEYDSALYASALANGSSTAAQEQLLFAQMDQLVARVKAATRRSKVDLLAHSLGTKLMQDYLNSSPARAANVAHYVNIDGMTAASPPGGVPTLALWGTKGPISQPPGRRIAGAENVDIPDSSHVQAATSPLSFKYFYKFFNGKAPKTTQIVPQKGRITIAGRDVDFPDNGGLTGATVQVWNINQSTGQRIGTSPIASFAIGSSGDFGPVTVQAGRRYEFAEVRRGFPIVPTHHFYLEPFLRSDHLVRLLESDALRALGGPPDPRFSAMVIIRYKELWGDQGAENDILKINGLSVCTPATCPLNKEVNGLFAADFDRDSKSNPNETWPAYNNASPYFISSVDVFAPAASPPTGEVTVSLRDRSKGPLHTIAFPNFPSSTDVVTLQFDDFTQAASTNSTTPKANRRRRPSRRSRRGGSRRRTNPPFTG